MIPALIVRTWVLSPPPRAVWPPMPCPSYLLAPHPSWLHAHLQFPVLLLEVFIFI